MRVSDEHRLAYRSIAGPPPSLGVGHVGGKNLNLDFILRLADLQIQPAPVGCQPRLPSLVEDHGASR